MGVHQLGRKIITSHSLISLLQLGVKFEFNGVSIDSDGVTLFDWCVRVKTDSAVKKTTLGKIKFIANLNRSKRGVKEKTPSKIIA